jgi:hypothetical protein
MKNILLGAFIFLSLTTAAQNVSGFYSGTLYNDTTKQTQVYELALSDYRGKITGYAYATFVANDTFYYSIRRVKASKKGGHLVVEDADMLANNFPKGPDKGVRRITQVPINHLTEEDTLSDFNATWKTTATKEFYSLPGTMTMQRSNDSSHSALLAHLTELRIQPTANERAAIAKREEKPKAPQKERETFTPTATKASTASAKNTTPPAPVAATMLPYNQRGQKLLQTFEVTDDSLILSFYDNGVVDGDVISVYVNGQNIVSHSKLLEVATKKTVRLDNITGNEIELVLVAETLGEMPPNTGLLVVQDGAKRYEVRFSADLQTNAALIFKKRK